MNIRRRGGQVIVINPVKEIGLVNFSVPSDVRSLLFGSKIASLYVQPHIGGDMALLTGMAKVVLEQRSRRYRLHRRGHRRLRRLRRHVRATTWDEIEQSSGVDRATHRARWRSCMRRPSTPSSAGRWASPITSTASANVQAIVNLALLRGMVGRPHAGLLPIRGHSNVQGIGSVGVVPNLKQKVLDNLETYLSVPLPRTPGLDTMACMQAADRGEIRSAFCLGGNLFGSNPDAQFAQRALGKLELVTYLNTTLNTGHAWGRGKETLILPVLARDEEPQPTTQESMFNFVRLSDGGPARLQGPRCEADIIASRQRVFGEKARSTGQFEAAQKHPGNHCSRRARVRGDRSSRTNQTGIPCRRPHLPRAAFRHADRQGAVHVHSLR